MAPQESDIPSAFHMTGHAVKRFQERIEPLEWDVIQDWARLMWKRRKGVPAHLKTKIRARTFKGKVCEYLVCRAPGGKPAFLALSEDRTAVLTVLTASQWSRFIGTPVSMHEKKTEWAMNKIIAMDKENVLGPTR